MFNLTVEDASKRLGVGRARVNQLIRSGMLAAEKVGGIWLIDEQSVEARRNAAPKAGRPPASSSKGDVGRYVLMNRTHEVLSFRGLLGGGDLVGRAGRILCGLLLGLVGVASRTSVFASS